MALPTTWTSPSTEEQSASSVLPTTRVNRILGNLLKLAGTAGPDWVAFTPTLTQSASITITVTSARYAILNKTAFVQIVLTCSSAGTAGNAISVNAIPAAIQPKAFGTYASLGVWTFFDNATNLYAGTVRRTGATTMQLMQDASASPFGASVTIASGDELSLQLVYEIA